MGVFESSSSNAVEVIANVVPFHLRMTELCSKEWVKTMSLPDDHMLKKLSLEAGYEYSLKKGTPLGYLNFISKDIESRLKEEKLSIRQIPKLSSSTVEDRLSIEEFSIFDTTLGNSKTRTKEQEEIARKQFIKFKESVETETVLAFTDGSVLGENCFGEGGCGVVMYSKKHGKIEKVSKKVGRMVDNVKCEIEGILTALEMSENIHEKDNSTTKMIILSDCKSAIDILVGQNELRKNWEDLNRLWKAVRKTRELGMECCLIWIPGHANIEMNEEADQLAKIGSKIIGEGQQEVVSSSVVTRWIREKIYDRWNNAWNLSETGWWTRTLIGKVGRRLKFPRDRSTGMTYVRLLVNNTAVKENMYRFGLVEDKECEWEEGIQSIQHILMECKNEREGRKDVERELGELWMNESPKAGNLPFDMRLILAPFSIDKINDTLADKMIFCTFKFLTSLSKLL